MILDAPLRSSIKKDRRAQVVDIMSAFVGISVEDGQHLLDSFNDKSLMIVLDTAKAVIEDLDFCESRLTDGFIGLVISAVKWDRLVSSPDLLSFINEIISHIWIDYPERRSTLMREGFVEAALEVMKKEMASGRLQGDPFRDNATSIRLVSELFPSVPRRKYFLGDKLIEWKLLSCGDDAFERHDRATVGEMLDLLRVTFPVVFELCRLRGADPDHYVLLFKLIYWANEINLLPSLTSGESLAEILLLLFGSGDYNYTMIGMQISDFLIKYCRFPERTISRYISSELSRVQAIASHTRWMEIFHVVLQFRNKVVFRSYSIEMWISSILQFILTNDDGSSLLQKYLNERYLRLTTFIEMLLQMPINSMCSTKRPGLELNGIKVFESLVSYVIGEIDELLSKKPMETLESDMFPETTFARNITGPQDMSLGLFRTTSYDRVLGPSRQVDKLENDQLLQALRLLSILNVVNENWGSLFCVLTTKPIISRELFVSHSLQEQIRYWLPKSTFEGFAHGQIPPILEKAVEEYPFLVSTSYKMMLFKMKWSKMLVKRKHFEYSQKKMSVPRNGVFHYVVEHLKELQETSRMWKFTFIGENGTGHGVTKEFYTEFSRDIQRHELDLWIGEAIEGSEGVLFTHSTFGMFPKPLSEQGLESQLNAIGMIVAKSICDNEQLDLNMSRAFYKAMFCVNPDDQCLTLVDLKHVMPSVYDFVEKLVDALRQKWFIESNESLTIDERRQALDRIVCDGSTLESLGIDFSLPGFPNIEMVPGAVDTILTINNVVEYLKHLTWWLLYKGPRNRMNIIREGFNIFMPTEYLLHLYPDEIEKVLCGTKNETWSYDYLVSAVNLEDNLNVDVPFVRYLLEVLSSFNEVEQRRFLMFVTSRSNLPYGGLRRLHPRLTVMFKGSMGNPDTYLPSAMTCFNTLFITNYSCKEALKEKLLLAISEGTNSFEFE